MLTILVDYLYYKEIYEGSSIPNESSFKKYSLQASSKINFYTFNRINGFILDDNIKNTAIEIAELLYYQENLVKKQDSTTSDKSSETAGPHSVSYVNKTTLQANRILSKEELDKECYRICYEHLSITGLMYRGAC